MAHPSPLAPRESVYGTFASIDEHLTKQEESDEPEHCGTCNGTGEGMHDGTRCMSCNGKGVIVPRDDRWDGEEPERDDPRDDYLDEVAFAAAKRAADELRGVR